MNFRLIAASSAFAIVAACASPGVVTTASFEPGFSADGIRTIELESMSRIEVLSDADFETTLSRLRSAINAKQNVRVISTVDHAKNASSVGKSLSQNTVLTFGNPRAGTEFMAINPQIGLHLPLKMQVYVDGEDVVVAYTSIDSMAARFSIDPAAVPVEKVRKTLADLAKSATTAP